VQKGEDMEDSEWINEETAKFYMRLINDPATLIDFSRALKIKSLWTPNLDKVAVRYLGMSEKEAYKADYWEVATECAVNLLGDREITDEQYDKLIQYLSNSELMIRHNHLIDMAPESGVKIKPITKKEEKPKMKMMKFETKYFVNDTDASQLTTEQRIGLIRSTEQQIESLEAIKTKSTLVWEEIAKAKAFLDNIVTLFDKK